MSSRLALFVIAQTGFRITFGSSNRPEINVFNDRSFEQIPFQGVRVLGWLAQSQLQNVTRRIR
ncbi:hypothetical protein B0E33_29960 (plasmid) [Roseibium algicola]|jgi:hypothetical protein|uniref:Uncharacterized protein n=1 Tax=Roseibium algicola TaxID=2857014 RepID=A0ABN4X0T1_9HYPH|nr:hypothetical protein B0E33_29960 [Roseibium aggregatum]